MQVTVEKVSDLERKMTVELPAEQINIEVAKRLQNLTKTAKIDGFRKGKVPVKEVERRYGKAVRQEVLGDMMQRSFFEAVNEKELRPAGMPNIQPKDDVEGASFEFTATFEVYPEIKLPDFSKLKIEKEVASIEDKDIDETLAAIQKQHVEWQEVARASKNGDQVTIDFDGSIDGEKLEKGSAKDFALELGSNSMIPGFEEGIVGAKAGDELTVSPTFPKDYHAKELAGKTVAFAIKVNKVSESKLPTLDDAFAKRLNIKEGTVDSLRQEIRSNMGRELASRMKNKAKQAVMDAVFKAAKVNLPKALVDAEIQQMQQHLLQQLGGKGDIQALTEQSGGIFEEQATRRVTLGLLIGEYIKKQEMKPDADKVKAHIDEMALSYEKPEDVVQWYYGDKDRLAEVQALILEEQVVDNILSQAKVTEKPVKFADVMKQNDQNHGLSHDHDHSNCQDHDHQH